MYGFARILNGFHTSKIDYLTGSVFTTLQRLVPTLGSTEKLSAPSCKHLQTQFSECETSPKNGAYWVNGMLVCLVFIF